MSIIRNKSVAIVYLQYKKQFYNTIFNSHAKYVRIIDVCKR